MVVTKSLIMELNDCRLAFHNACFFFLKINAFVFLIPVLHISFVIYYIMFCVLFILRMNFKKNINVNNCTGFNSNL